MLDTNATGLIYYGESRPPRGRIQDSAGDLTFVLEDGMLKHVRLGSIEIARRIYFAIRDAQWNTIPCTISDPRIVRADGEFRANWTGRSSHPEIGFEWSAELRIAPPGSIQFRIHGKSLTTFVTPRVGLCLLLSSTATVDRDFEVTHINGQSGWYRFDRIFKRTQLASRWKSLRFHPHSDVEVEYSIEGSHFDIEDQRNFGDVTYKAMVGMPYHDQTAHAGEEHTQILTIAVKAGAFPAAPAKPITLKAAPREINGRMPHLGMSLDGGETSAATEDIASFPGFLYARLDCASPQFSQQADIVRTVARKTGRPLYLTLAGLNDDCTPEVAAVLKAWTGNGIRILQLDAPESVHPSLAFLRAVARESEIAVPCGKRVTNFKERAALLEAANSGADFLAWSGTPFIHQHDDETLIENAGTWCDQAITARTFASSIGAATGPVRLVADDPAAADPRYRGLIASSFVASSVKSLAEGKVESAVMFDAVGPRGHVGEDGRAHPSFHILKELSALAGRATFPIASSDALAVEAFGVTAENGDVVVLINLTPEPQPVALSGLYPRGTRLHLRTVDEASYPAITDSEATTTSDMFEAALAPFSVHFIRQNSN